MHTKFCIQQEPGFYLNRDKATIPPIIGIYIVYKGSYDSFMDTVNIIDVLYIGEANNIKESHNGTLFKPSNHERYDEFVRQAGGANCICYGVIPMEEHTDNERKWIKDAMIYSQQPPLNIGIEKTNYSHPPIDLYLNGLPDCWRNHHIQLPL